MQITDENIQIVKRKYDAIADCLTEKGRRLWSASEAISYGYGGASLVSQMFNLFLDSSLAIFEMIFGPVFSASDQETFYTQNPRYNLGSELIFQILETFYEYNKSFYKFDSEDQGVVSRQMIHFLPTDAAAPAAINFVALNILNETTRSMDNISPDLKTRLIASYSNTVYNTESEFIRSKGYEGLAILNYTPLYVSVSLGWINFKETMQNIHAGDILTALSMACQGVIFAIDHKIF